MTWTFLYLSLRLVLTSFVSFASPFISRRGRYLARRTLVPVILRLLVFLTLRVKNYEYPRPEGQGSFTPLLVLFPKSPALLG